MKDLSIAMKNEEFYFYQEPDDDDHVCLKFQGDNMEFETFRNGAAVRIPVALWAVIRQAAATEVNFALADKTDGELLEMVESEVEERITELKKARRRGRINQFALLSSSSIIGCSPIYGLTTNPREKQIESGMQHYRKVRKLEQHIRQQMEEILAGTR